MKIIVKSPRTGGTAPPKTASIGAMLNKTQATAREIKVFIDGVDSGLLPQDVTEVYLGTEDPCLVRLSHDGVAPVGAGEFESGTLGNCLDTDIIYNEGDTIGTLPGCSSTMDIVVECAPSDPLDSGSPLVPWVIVRNSALEIIASRSLDDVFPPIDLIINAVNVGTVSRCATEVEVTTEGICEWNGETCVGSGTVTVNDGQGGSYSEGFGC